MSNIKQTTESLGWQEILDIFQEEVLNNTNTSNIKESLSPEHIKLEVMTRNKAAKIIKKVLNKINKIANSESIKEKVIYR